MTARFEVASGRRLERSPRTPTTRQPGPPDTVSYGTTLSSNVITPESDSLMAALKSYLRWISVDRIAVMSLPFMFYSSFMGSVHMAVTDFILPVMVLLALIQPATHRRSLALRPLVFYVVALLAIVTLSVLTADLTDPDFS